MHYINNACVPKTTKKSSKKKKKGGGARAHQNYYKNDKKIGTQDLLHTNHSTPLRVSCADEQRGGTTLATPQTPTRGEKKALLAKVVTQGGPCALPSVAFSVEQLSRGGRGRTFRAKEAFDWLVDLLKRGTIRDAC